MKKNFLMITTVLFLSIFVTPFAVSYKNKACANELTTLPKNSLIFIRLGNFRFFETLIHEISKKYPSVINPKLIYAPVKARFGFKSLKWLNKKQSSTILVTKEKMQQHFAITFPYSDKKALINSLPAGNKKEDDSHYSIGTGRSQANFYLHSQNRVTITDASSIFDSTKEFLNKVRTLHLKGIIFDAILPVSSILQMYGKIVLNMKKRILNSHLLSKSKSFNIKKYINKLMSMVTGIQIAHIYSKIKKHDFFFGIKGIFKKNSKYSKILKQLSKKQIKGLNNLPYSSYIVGGLNMGKQNFKAAYKQFMNFLKSQKYDKYLTKKDRLFIKTWLKLTNNNYKNGFVTSFFKFGDFPFNFMLSAKINNQVSAKKSLSDLWKFINSRLFVIVGQAIAEKSNNKKSLPFQNVNQLLGFFNIMGQNIGMEVKKIAVSSGKVKFYGLRINVDYKKLPRSVPEKTKKIMKKVIGSSFSILLGSNKTNFYFVMSPKATKIMKKLIRGKKVVNSGIFKATKTMSHNNFLFSFSPTGTYNALHVVTNLKLFKQVYKNVSAKEFISFFMNSASSSFNIFMKLSYTNLLIPLINSIIKQKLDNAPSGNQ